LDRPLWWTSPCRSGRIGTPARTDAFRVEKIVKNRFTSIFARTPSKTEVQRLEGLGRDASKADVKWVVMADPAGHEFCVLRSLAEKGGSSNSD
jgi:Glyoxalase-like domain